MKKIIALAGLAVLASNSAEASKARLLALGENLETAGSLYFSDNRNIFQNAAFIHEYSDAVYLEWGSQGNQVNPSTGDFMNNKADTDANPQAEGGFLRTHGNFVYGLHFGAESYITHEARSYLRLGNSTSTHQDNQIDAFFGSKFSNGVKWGANVTYSNTNDDSNKSEQKSASIRLGLMGDKWEGYANVAVMNEANASSMAFDGTNVINGTGKDKFKGEKGWELGGSYDLGWAKAFGYWRHGSWEQNVDSPIGFNPADLNDPDTASGAVYSGKTNFDTNRVRLGLGRELKINDRTTIFTKAEYVMTNREVKAKGTNGGKVNIDDYYVPVVIGVEHDATSWLTLRGSVSQNILGEQDNNFRSVAGISPLVRGMYAQGKRSFANSTNVNAGMTLKFGDLSIDGVIGTSGANGMVGASSKDAKVGVLSLDNLASRVAMTYKF